jgi:Right handed beta helix region
VTLTVGQPGCNRVTSLAAARSEIAAGRDACLADGAYSGALTLSTSASSQVRLSAEHRGQAQISGLVTLNRHTAIDGLNVTNSSDCVSIPTSQTDIAILNSTLQNCGRDGIRWARPALDGSNESRDVRVSGNRIANAGWNSMTIRGDAATVTNNELTGSTNDAITLWGDGHVFRSNWIHDYSNSVGNHNDAFQTWGGGDDGFRGTPLTNLVVEGNRIVNILGTDAHGFMIQGTNSNLTLRRNLWSNIGSYALNAQPGQTNVDVLYNTFANTGILEFNTSTTGRIVGNIFSGVGAYYVTGCTCTRDYNLATTWTPTETHGLRADPKFAGASDFHLQAASPAVDSGDPATVPPIDADGRPANGVPDRGAYER